MPSVQPNKKAKQVCDPCVDFLNPSVDRSLARSLTHSALAFSCVWLFCCFVVLALALFCFSKIVLFSAVIGRCKLDRASLADMRSYLDTKNDLEVRPTVDVRHNVVFRAKREACIARCNIKYLPNTVACGWRNAQHGEKHT